jgi:hypothetical protein
MANCIKKINCVVHEDSTPSLAIYDDGNAFCFGCGFKTTVKDLDLNIEHVPAYTDKPKFKENIESSMQYINSLPNKFIRGHVLPYDDDYYFIKWPQDEFYKKRLIKQDAKSKYRSPVGIKKPLYKWGHGGDNLLIIEGEFNALTAYKSADLPKCDIVSPGAATDFMRKDYLQQYLSYVNIIIIVDRDAAGICAGIELKAFLQGKGKKVGLHPMVKDLNDILVQDGQEEVNKTIKSIVSMFRVWGR